MTPAGRKTGRGYLAFYHSLLVRNGPLEGLGFCSRGPSPRDELQALCIPRSPATPGAIRPPVFTDSM
jgi:hypothetical protein